MEDILVATAARPQGAHFDEKLEDRQPQCRVVPVPASPEVLVQPN
jgi:hypothetical protein